MSLALYMDVQVPIAITRGLRALGVDVLTAQEDGAGLLPDDELLDRATELGRVLFTLDDDFHREATQRQNDDRDFAGVVIAEQLRITVGRAILDLELIAKVYDPEDVANRVEYLPL